MTDNNVTEQTPEVPSATWARSARILTGNKGLTGQVVFLERPEVADQITALAIVGRESKAEVGRRILERALPGLWSEALQAHGQKELDAALTEAARRRELGRGR